MSITEAPHGYKGIVKLLEAELKASGREVNRYKKLFEAEKNKYNRLFERKVMSAYDLKEELKSSNYRAAHYKKLYEKSLGANNG